ncbi:MAG: hypothetical protein H7318_13635 [Oligoflexus sp.]|nr:hypothetical protein [Oligoflexus sp.]
MFRLMKFLFLTFTVNACKSVGEKSQEKSLSDLGGIPNLLKKAPVMPLTLADNLAELSKTRSIYKYSDNKIPGVSILSDLPDEQAPDNEWSILVLIKLRKIRENTLSIYNNLGTWLNAKYPDQQKEYVFQNKPEFKDVFGTVKLIVVKNFDSIIRFYLFKTGNINRGKEGWATQISDFELVFPVLPKPLATEIVTNDDRFANSYVAGLNPMVIEGVADLQSQFKAIDDLSFKNAPGFQNDSLAEAFREKRLYIVDLAFMRNTIAGQQHPTREKHVYGPKGLFAVPKGGSSLKPVAITIDEIKAPQIVTPKDGEMWTIAKTILNSAAANHHELYAHLSQTHLVVDPIAVSCYRHLSTHHPLSRLMRPHFHGTMFINSLAVTLLAREGEVVDIGLWGSSESNRRAILSAVQQYSLNDMALPGRLLARKLDSIEGLPNLPYRDDSLLIWNAMRQWIVDYVDAWYPTEESVKNDLELGLWVQEIQSPYAIEVKRQNQKIITEVQKDQPGGNLKAFGKNGAIETKDDLVAFLTVTMFTASAQHAAVNFPQTDMMFTPNYPLALYEKVPTPGNASNKDLMNMLPSLDLAALQLEFLGFLGQVYYTHLGGYPTFQFAADSKVHSAFNRYRENLANIERQIVQRNSNSKVRPFTYTHLLPSKIPMSINI